MPQQLVVIGFDDPRRAQELLRAAARLQQEGGVALEDAVVVTKDVDGRTHRIETTDVTPAEGALAGAFWGLLFGTAVLGPLGGAATATVMAGAGALIGRLVDRGIADEFIRELRDDLHPGTSAVAFLVNEAEGPRVVDALRPFDGHLVFSTLSETASQAVAEALRTPSERPGGATLSPRAPGG